MLQFAEQFTDTTNVVTLSRHLSWSIWLNSRADEPNFNLERSSITKHIGNVFNHGKLHKKSNVQNLHISGSDRPDKEAVLVTFK